jgi:predicted transcriptional regulator
MDLTLYILIALLIFAVNKWRKWRDRFIVSDRRIADLEWNIKVSNYEIARRDELIEIFERRRDMAAVEDVKTFKISNEKYWLN